MCTSFYIITPSLVGIYMPFSNHQSLFHIQVSLVWAYQHQFFIRFDSNYCALLDFTYSIFSLLILCTVFRLTLHSVCSHIFFVVRFPNFLAYNFEVVWSRLCQWKLMVTIIIEINFDLDKIKTKIKLNGIAHQILPAFQRILEGFSFKYTYFQSLLLLSPLFNPTPPRHW